MEYGNTANKALQSYDGITIYIAQIQKHARSLSNVLGNGTTAAGGSSVAQCLNLMLAKEGENLNTEQLLEEGRHA